MNEPVAGVHQVLSGYVNAFCVETDGGLVLIDTGLPNSERRILRAIAAFGYQPADIRHIVITHAHPDHYGSLAALLDITGAECWAHEADADSIEAGTLPPIYPGPGILAQLLFLVSRLMPAKMKAAKVDHRVKDGDVLPGGLIAVHAPGHSPGQIALMWPSKRLLFAADTVMNILGLKLSLMNEDQALAGRTAAKVAALDFDRALFGHGAYIANGASAQFREAFVRT
jgi:glyoxylase-like metal-dependent hydrolase (beta-lactamase superfamily II)